MKKILTLCGALAGLSFPALATPSSTVWTNCSVDFQPPGLTHVTYDTYVTLGSRGPDRGGESLPTDYGLTWGARLGRGLQAEYGADYYAPSDTPWAFNGKVGYPEGALGRNAPALQVGLFNVGTRRGVSNMNVVHLLTGKTLSAHADRLMASIYYGNPGVLKSSGGDRENTGFMVAYDRPLIPDKVVLAADYASGRNALGGGAVGVYYYFNERASLLAGPVWFNDKGLNGQMKWTVQLDLNF